MSYCACDCAHTVSTLEREASRLTDNLRSLEYRMDALQRDLEREIVDRQDVVRSVRSDVSDLYLQVQS
jgi:hypothetical protein